MISNRFGIWLILCFLLTTPLIHCFGERGEEKKIDGLWLSHNNGSLAHHPISELRLFLNDDKGKVSGTYTISDFSNNVISSGTLLGIFSGSKVEVRLTPGTCNQTLEGYGTLGVRQASRGISKSTKMTITVAGRGCDGQPIEWDGVLDGPIHFIQ